MGRWLGHTSCPSCGSKDNVSVWDDGYRCETPGCGYCGRGAPGGEPSGFTPAPPTPREVTGVIAAIPERRISEATCKAFGVTVDYASDGNINNMYFPIPDLDTGEFVATKKKLPTAPGEKKDFRWSGDRSNAGLFGEQVCRGKGKFITITEGEIDALSVYEMFGGKCDVVSLRDGASSAKRDIQTRLEYLEKYDTVVLSFDQDSAGQKALEEVRDLFSPGKVRIVRSNLKDANEHLVERQAKDYVSAWWDAKPYRPDGIISISETWEDVLKYKNTPSTPYPWDGLNDLLLGQRTKEIVVWAAETGVGKSQTMRELIAHCLKTTDENVGALMLEESIAKTTLGWMSFVAGRPLHKELNTVPEAELKKYWDQVSHDGRLFLLDHRGWRNDIDTLKSRVRYMAISLGCKKIVLDHLHIALSSVSGATGDWSGIDELVTDLEALAIELDICLHLVSHVSEGRSLRGSKGISKIVDAVVFLERDKHHEDPEIRNTTRVVVDKNRFAGDTGTACWLRYDPMTGRMLETSAPEAASEYPEEF